MTRCHDIILRTEGLTKHYGGVHALEGADFELRDGEHVAIVGDNGAGKSTFVRQITGVEQPTSGKIFFDGKEVDFAGPDRGARRRHRDRVPEPGAGRRSRRAVEPVPRPREGAASTSGRSRILDRKIDAQARPQEALTATAVKIPNLSQHDPQHVGRPAPVRGDRPAATFASKLDHHGRADGGARRAGDGAGREHHPQPEGARRSR